MYIERQLEMEMVEDQDLLVIAEPQKDHNTGECISFSEVFSKDGLVLADIDAMEDVEIA